MIATTSEDYPERLELDVRKEFASAAQLCRSLNDLSIAQLAKRAGLDPRTVMRAETGGRVREQSIYKLASALEHLEPALYFDFQTGEVRLTAPEQSPALLVAEWRDGLVRRKASRTLRGELDANHSLRRAWVAMRDFCDDLLSYSQNSNWQRLANVLERYSKALGSTFEQLDVVALGIHGERLIGLTQVVDHPITEESMEDLRALARTHGPFVLQFEEWKEYVETAFPPPPQDALREAKTAARQLGETDELIAEDVRSLLMQLVADQDDAPDDLSRRELINGVRNILAAVFLPVVKGAQSGAEALTKATVLLGGGGGMLSTLAATYPQAYGWLLPWIEKLASLVP